MINRRDFIKTVAATLPAARLLGADWNPSWEWIRSCRAIIAEAYNPPFYPSFDYRAEKAVQIAKSLGADSFRYPAASYYAYFPTATRYPVHPELGDTDPFKETIERCHKAGLKVIAYMPLNHPFMEVRANNPRYLGWAKKSVDGKPMTTEHYGFTRYYEGCLNSPVRDEIRAMVREVVTKYEIDAAYFDGPYMGMQNARRFCRCQHCEEAYRKARGKRIPDQDGKLNREEEIEYTRWLAEDVVIAYLAEIREMIRRERNVPVLYNDTSLLSRREWRNRAIPVVDGFMFEAAETPEEKLFNLGLGRSTGKVIWTYVGTHTQYNREHMKNERVRGWFSWPVESEELLLDGATALAGNAGLKYWGLSRFFYMPDDPVRYPAGKYVREVFDFAAKHREILFNARQEPLAGILVGSQTIDWFEGKLFMAEPYKNCYHGAFQVLKELCYACEPFLDYRLDAETLRRYRLLYIPNAPCLSDSQCRLIREYVNAGGVLLATHLTSIADEYGRMRGDFGLGDLFGARLLSPDPIEIPDLYLKPAGQLSEIPQDPQIVRFEALDPADVIAETLDRGHRRNLGAAVLRRSFGKGTVIYIGSSLEAVYQETHMKPVRDYIGSLIEPLVGERRIYRVDPRAGLMPHFTMAGNSLLLHLLANTGNKSKKLRMREEFLPFRDVTIRIRIPDGRKMAGISLLRTGRPLEGSMRDGWFAATVPEVRIHELIEIRLEPGR